MKQPILIISSKHMSHYKIDLAHLLSSKVFRTNRNSSTQDFHRMTLTIAARAFLKNRR